MTQPVPETLDIASNKTRQRSPAASAADTAKERAVAAGSAANPRR